MRVSGVTLMLCALLVATSIAGCAARSEELPPVPAAAVAARPATADDGEGPFAFVCPGGPPVGPGAATRANLAPWLAGAPAVTYTGELMYFHCTSEHGNYWT